MKIPGLWERFFQEGIVARVPNRKPRGVTIGAYTKYESDHTGPHWIWDYFLDGSSHKRLYTTDYEAHGSADRVDVHVAVA